MEGFFWEVSYEAWLVACHEHGTISHLAYASAFFLCVYNELNLFLL